MFRLLNCKCNLEREITQGICHTHTNSLTNTRTCTQTHRNDMHTPTGTHKTHTHRQTHSCVRQEFPWYSYLHHAHTHTTQSWVRADFTTIISFPSFPNHLLVNNSDGDECFWRHRHVIPCPPPYSENDIIPADITCPDSKSPLFCSGTCSSLRSPASSIRIHRFIGQQPGEQWGVLYRVRQACVAR